MPALVEIRLFDDAVWYDDDYNTWVDCDYNTWVETSLSVRLSHEGYAGDRYWDQKVISFAPPQYRISNNTGGYCKIGFGDMTVELDTFDELQQWPPPEKCLMTISYADDSGTITEILNGILHLKTMSRDGISYQMHEKTLDVMLLEEGVNFDGDTVPMPRAFGAVDYQVPERLADDVVTGYQVYHHGYMSGTVGVDWHVFDDGVNIDANVESATSTTFQLNTLPVGQVTVSGAGTITSITEIFEWACDSTRLNLSLDATAAAAFDAGRWETGQDTLVSFLDKLAAYAGHLFYMTTSEMFLVDMDADNGTDMDLTENDFLPSIITWASPVSNITAEWTRGFAVEETIGKYVKYVKKESTYTGEHPYGSQVKIEPYQNRRLEIEPSLAKIYRLMSSDRWETSIPLDSVYPLPGQKIIAIDESMGKKLTIEIHARDIEYDFDNRLIRISGEGTIQ